MPEAVIVATARSPIGRAFKGSLKDLRPDDLAVQMVHAVLAKLPGLDPRDIDDLMLGCGLPGGEQGFTFAAQVLPSARDLGVDPDKLNVNGGAIAVGHPFGMTGARITSTLVNSLQWHDKELGLETMCVGGGQGMAMVLERLS
jgi:acetyl-CoA acetyltransferase